MRRPKAKRRPDVENRYARRIEDIRNIMRSRNWDAVVISGSDPHGSEYIAPRWRQVAWVSGYDGEGELVITLDHAGLWTDSRYFIQAGRQLPGTGIELHKTRVPDAVPIPEWLAKQAARADDFVIAVDGDCQPSAFVDALEAACIREGCDFGADAMVRVVNAPGMLDDLWTDRPPVPCTPVITIGTELTGESRRDRIGWLRDVLEEKGCDAILLTALDEIAWLLNVRASDIPYNPVCLSYLVVTMDRVLWYVRKDEFSRPDGETRDSFAELRADGVDILGYEEAGYSVSALFEDGAVGRLYADPSTLNYSLFRILQDNPLLLGPSPIPLRKAVKNPTETAGMRDAHIEDGIAMERFLYWLEKSMAFGDIVTERDAADRLAAFRAEAPGYKGDSFETISAYGPGGALPHYVTPAYDAPKLEPRGLYLCDSGGQYVFGTTDITRTVPLGPCTQLEREDYTLVLKGHIDLAMAVFPKGTAGCQLDVLARNPLWQSKRNFGHGTGHGVGFFLNVHEGPQEFRQNFNPQPLLPGMITSDEPGIYREGRHGVRHESLLLCREAGTNDFGTWLEFEVMTLCHIDTSAIVRDLLTPQEIDWLNAYNRRVCETLRPRLPEAVAGWLEQKTRPI